MPKTQCPKPNAQNLPIGTGLWPFGHPTKFRNLSLGILIKLGNISLEIRQKALLIQ
jgi:hypothetical protein